MAQRKQLGYKEIEEKLKRLKTEDISPADIGYSILSAFGKSDADIRRYKQGKGIMRSFDGLLIKELFCYKEAETAELAATLESLKADTKVMAAMPKIIAVSDGKTLLAYDTREKDSYEVPVKRVYCDFIFFYPLMNKEKVHNIEENPADVKAAEKLAKLHDQLRVYNDFSSDADLHDLNIFVTRLLFCFFAEDTGIFEHDIFTNSIRKYTKTDGSDLNDYLDSVFNVMDERLRSDDTPRIIGQFPYVNGGLFRARINIPKIGYKGRKIILECGDLDWADINPDIFGSMFQAIVNPELRAIDGMHYTSVPNIMKVINPLFMDELRGEYNRLNDLFNQQNRMFEVGGISKKEFEKVCRDIKQGCYKLRLRMSRMKFFDPACGSGNFLIITYKCLRLLEMDIITLIHKCEKFIPGSQQDLEFVDISDITIDQFYGIELEDFPYEVAMLSLWLAQHQMDNKFHKDFGVNVKALPLQNIKNIVCGNACRMDWNEVCPHTPDEEVYLFGNPPYKGSSLQTSFQKEDKRIAIGKIKNYKKLDYIAIWFVKAARFCKNSNSKFAFVSTNSICQGEQVYIIWPTLLKDYEISFAWPSIKWSNNAKNKAGVTVSIIGLEQAPSHKYIFKGTTKKEVKNISPYLLDMDSVIVHPERSSISGLQPMIFGSKASGSDLVLTSEERENIINEYPEAEKYIKRYVGADNLINDFYRYCIWVTDEEYKDADKIEPLHNRFESCRLKRLKSPKGPTRLYASYPYKFTEIRYKDESCLVVPCVSSENRDYIPIVFVTNGYVVDNSSQIIYDVTPFTFGIITSKMHMIWVGTVGGKLEERYRYSAVLCYNTFPVPKLSEKQKKDISDAAEEVLLIREDYPGKSLAELYNPETMPAPLLQAHQKLDDIVDSCYPGYPFSSDEDRLECLFKLYEKMTKSNGKK